MHMKQNDSSRIQLLDKIIDIIEVVSLYPAGLSLGMLSAETGINKSTVFRIANALVDHGYFEREESGKYRLTMRIYEIGLRVFGGVDLNEIMHPYLQKLANCSGECVHFGYVSGTDVIYLDKVDPSNSYFRISTKIGYRNPVYVTGMGKIVAAHMSEEKQKKIWEDSTIIARTPNTITSFDKMRQELMEAQKNGYAIDHEEWELGVCCIAVAVENFDKEPTYAISITIPSARFNEEIIQKFYPLLRECANNISLMLGKKSS